MVEIDETQDVMDESGVIYAMPTLAMLPANNFKIQISEELYSFTLPCKGSYIDLDSEYFSEEDGDFVVYDNNVFQVSTITKVMFGMKKYPALKDNQLFCPISFSIKDELVYIDGKVVTMLGD